MKKPGIVPKAKEYYLKRGEFVIKASDAKKIVRKRSRKNKRGNSRR